MKTPSLFPMLVLASLCALASGVAHSTSITFHDSSDVITATSNGFQGTLSCSIVTSTALETLICSGSFFSMSLPGQIPPGIAFLLEADGSFSDSVEVSGSGVTDTGATNAGFNSLYTIVIRMDSDRLEHSTFFPIFGITESGGPDDITNEFRDDLTNQRISLPDNLSIFVISDIDVPEPASFTLLGVGLAGLWAIRRRKLPIEAWRDPTRKKRTENSGAWYL